MNRAPAAFTPPCPHHCYSSQLGVSSRPVFRDPNTEQYGYAMHFLLNNIRNGLAQRLIGCRAFLFELPI